MNRDMLEQVFTYIDGHIYEKISLCDLADLIGYSPFYFSKLFSESMGMPVTGYIRIRKLQYAIASLLEGSKVLDAAVLYAFDSHEGFTRSFTQLFGSTPSTVRKYLTSYTVPKIVIPEFIKGRFTMEGINSLQYNMHQLIFEFLEQSIEEAKEGYCSNIEITMMTERRIKISDNGRGLPLSEDLHASKAVLDKILAGSPISNTEYSQMGDLMQAGLQTVNSLCEALQIIVTRGEKTYQQDYIRGIAQHELYISNSNEISGTTVLFKPDTAIFGTMEFSFDTLNEWVKDKTKGIDNLKLVIKIIVL